MEEIQHFLPLITGAIGGASAAGVFAGPINTLEDWWYINFGHNVSQKAELLKAERDLNIQSLRDGALEYASKISPKNIQEPKLNILGPALEASKYYIDEEEIRDMFAKLIASSMDSSKNNTIHPSYVEILKQLTPLDANNLNIINYSDRSPIAKYGMSLKTGGVIVLEELVFLENKDQQKIDLQASSISNLSRLGLVEYDFLISLTDKTNYNHLVDNDVTEIIKKSIDDEYGDERRFNVQKGIINLTPYGSSFCSICLPRNYAHVVLE